MYTRVIRSTVLSFDQIRRNSQRILLFYAIPYPLIKSDLFAPMRWMRIYENFTFLLIKKILTSRNIRFVRSNIPSEIFIFAEWYQRNLKKKKTIEVRIFVSNFEFSFFFKYINSRGKRKFVFLDSSRAIRCGWLRKGRIGKNCFRGIVLVVNSLLNARSTHISTE